MGLEFILSCALTIMINGIIVVYGSGKLTQKVESNNKNIEDIKIYIKEVKEDLVCDIRRLETKQDKYNTLQERIATVEQSSKSAHHRIDALVK